jgi:hypothetical protein
MNDPTPHSAPAQLLPIVPDLLRALSLGLQSVPGWPALAGLVLNTGAALIERGEAAAGELAALSADVSIMVKQGTAPSADQISRLEARSDAAHIALQITNLT